MKRTNILRLLGIIAFVSALGFLMVSCDFFDNRGINPSEKDTEVDFDNFVEPLVFKSGQLEITISRTAISTARATVAEPKVGDYYQIVQNRGNNNQEILSEGKITSVIPDGKNHFIITFTPYPTSPCSKTEYQGTLNSGGTVNTDGALPNEGGKLVILSGDFEGEYGEEQDDKNPVDQNEQEETDKNPTDQDNKTPTLAEQLAWIEANAQTGGNYNLTAWADESLAPHSLYYYGKDNITINLKGDGTMRTISLSSIGSMFDVGAGVTLILDNNITLKGRDNNNASVLSAKNGGNLIMNDGTITGNSVSGNTTGNPAGGGIIVNGGTFTMNGGVISGNFASGDTVGGSSGGGVQVTYGVFTMNGGVISGNFAYYHGGGVAVHRNGIFNMNAGTISGNTIRNGERGSVRVDFGGAFNMSGGAISGWVNFTNNIELTFNKTGGTIYASDQLNTVETSDHYTHAVCVYLPRLGTMSDSYLCKKTTAGPGVNLSYYGYGIGAYGSASGNWDY